MKKNKGYVILEALLAIVVLSMVVLSVIPMLSFLLSRTARSRFDAQASVLLQEGIEVSYNIFTSNWDAYPIDGTYHPAKTSNKNWVFLGGEENDLETRFSRSISVQRACRNLNGEIIDTIGGDCVGTRDTDSRIIKTTVRWEEEGKPKEISAKLLVVNIKK